MVGLGVVAVAEVVVVVVTADVTRATCFRADFTEYSCVVAVVTLNVNVVLVRAVATTDSTV